MSWICDYAWCVLLCFENGVNEAVNQNIINVRQWLQCLGQMSRLRDVSLQKFGLACSKRTQACKSTSEQFWWATDSRRAEAQNPAITMCKHISVVIGSTVHVHVRSYYYLPVKIIYLFKTIMHHLVRYLIKTRKVLEYSKHVQLKK